MTRKKISTEKCSYGTFTVTPEQKMLWKMQKKNDPSFNISAWIREQTFKCFSEENTIKQELETLLKKSEELQKKLKSFEDERQKDLSTIHINRFWWVRAAYVVGISPYPKVIQKMILEYRVGAGIKLEEKKFLNYVELVKKKYAEEIQQISDNPNLTDVEEYKKLKRVEQ